MVMMMFVLIDISYVAPKPHEINAGNQMKLLRHKSSTVVIVLLDEFLVTPHNCLVTIK